MKNYLFEAATILVAIGLAFYTGSLWVFFGIMACAMAEFILFSAQAEIKNTEKSKLLSVAGRAVIWFIMVAIPVVLLAMIALKKGLIT